MRIHTAGLLHPRDKAPSDEIRNGLKYAIIRESSRMNSNVAISSAATPLTQRGTANPAILTLLKARPAPCSIRSCGGAAPCAPPSLCGPSGLSAPRPFPRVGVSRKSTAGRSALAISLVQSLARFQADAVPLGSFPSGALSLSANMDGSLIRPGLVMSTATSVLRRWTPSRRAQRAATSERS